MTGMEPLISAAAASAVSGVAVPIFQSLWGSGGKFLGLFGKTLNEEIRELIFTASKQYVRNYEERHGILKVLGMREPVKLESVYTAVQFLDNDDIRSFESIENLEEYFRHRFQSQDKSKQQGIKVANDKQYLMVLGGPGAGKSTFGRKMGLEALKGKLGEFQHDCIPVFIELKTFTSSDIDIKKIIAEEFRVCKFPEPEQFTAKALEQGKLLILLDGLDEVPTQNLTEAIIEIQNFVDKYDKNRFIASCRTAAYRSGFRRFSDVAMADFDDTQIQQFIYNWFQCEADRHVKTGEKCWELLQKPEHRAAKELAHTPLLLTFLCLVYDRSQNFPNNRSVLYRKALRILLEEWASEKRILRDEIYQGLNIELEEILLSEIAYTGFESDRLFFSERDIVGQIKTFLASNLNAPQHLDGESVLNAIALQQGILVERAEDVFSFSHLTLQEYLTAQYIADNGLVKNLVTTHMTDERWKEVFLLVPALIRGSGGADDLLLWIEKEAQKYINTSKLQALLDWAEQATTGSVGDFKPVGKRAVAMEIANIIAYANAIVEPNPIIYANPIPYTSAIAYANTIDMDNVFAYAIAMVEATKATIGDAIQYTYNLEKLKIFNNIKFTVLIAQMEELKAKALDEQTSQEVLGAFVERLQQILLNAFNLSPDIINLSESESKALQNYLYANNLLIQCKQASVRVSPKTWEKIEARMLLGNRQN